ncbi:MAG: type I-E CRISPR-associated protein Cse2/CasB [Pelolinea sp.]|nr:type I-E CRISPR-associated protein Cse2/CasB [Pelolinea sp.]
MEKKSDFITYLEALKDERGKLAALRRGLGMPPGTCAAMYPVVAVRLPRNCSSFEEQRHYLIAALFGSHPLSQEQGNMGDHMRRASGEKITTAVERRFTRLLGLHWEDLANELRQTVSFLRSKGTPVNWHQLFFDLRYWGHEDRFVQRKWANAFWGYLPDQNESGKE